MRKISGIVFILSVLLLTLNAISSSAQRLPDPGGMHPRIQNLAMRIDPSDMAKKGEDAYNAGDYETAFAYLLAAAELGNADAQYRLGWMYDTGKGVDQSYATVLKYYLKAGDQGHMWALFSLGYFYYYGQGVQVSYEKAAEYMKRSADNGNDESMYFIGFLYQHGQGVPRSYKEALNYYQKAVSLGNRNAMFGLGELYEKGEGVPQSAENALKYYKMAADLGDKTAQEKVKKLSKITPPQKVSTPVPQLKVGNIFFFGRYEQGSGKDPIRWRVIKVSGRRALLLSEYIIEEKPYNTQNTAVTWETSSLRRWLNTDFYNIAFNYSEKNMIAEVTNSNPPTSGTVMGYYFRTEGGNATRDKIFLLSIDEAQDYYNIFHDWTPISTSYVTRKGGYSVNKDVGPIWWLRSPAVESNCAAMVASEGILTNGFEPVSTITIGVRSAIWINF